ncbi:MAG: hypothetical protein HYX78_02930 [Armatimonadetes bacterium]|nr:hypothetical protein [Armatimonadota bacterium]
MALQIALYALIAMVAGAAFLEVRSWRARARQVTARQKVYRIGAAVCLETVLVMLVFRWSIEAWEHPILWVFYWTAAFVFALALPVFALLDVRETLSAYRARRRQIVRDLLDDKRLEE